METCQFSLLALADNFALKAIIEIQGLKDPKNKKGTLKPATDATEPVLCALSPSK